MTSREELGAALRRARERVRPEQAGFPAAPGRRTPGLRREELAVAAGISADYVARLEQARGPQPSQQVLSALARALRLDADERALIFHLAQVSPPGPGRVDDFVRPSVLRLLDRFIDLPAIVLSATADVLAWNAMASALHGDWAALPPERRNLLRLRFLPDPADGVRSSVSDESADEVVTDAQLVGSLRATAARYPKDPTVAALVHELRTHSPCVDALWADVGAHAWRSHRKVVAHPALGPLTLDCDTLLVPDADQAVVVYSAAPRTPAAESLALLRVIGTQDLSPEVGGPAARAEREEPSTADHGGRINS